MIKMSISSMIEYGQTQQWFMTSTIGCIDGICIRPLVVVTQ